MKKPGRDGYTYQIEPSGEGFRVIAAPARLWFRAVRITPSDQTMEVRAEP